MAHIVTLRVIAHILASYVETISERILPRRDLFLSTSKELPRIIEPELESFRCAWDMSRDDVDRRRFELPKPVAASTPASLVLINESPA